jgi:predicted ATPase
LPLLGAVLNIQIPDNELTASFDAKLRKESLESLLLDCLRAWSHEAPLLLVLEDSQWIDPLSKDLLEVIGRAVADMRVLILLAYREEQAERRPTTRLSELPHFTEVRLGDLPSDEIEQLVRYKLGQIYGEGLSLQPALIRQITARAEGNPFYIEELLNYLRDRGLSAQQPAALEQVQLPSSLHSLILSRIDQLSENQQTMMKVASVIGRVFEAAMLRGIYQPLGSEDRVRHELEILSALDLMSLDTPEPELTYLFKHILTREVAYETLSFATRALLHEQIGKYIEVTYPGELDQYLDLLAYHYDHSENREKRREYLLRAGEAAQATYANAAAVSYYRRLLPLQPAEQQASVMLQLGQVLELMGEWQAAEENYRKAEELAGQLRAQPAQAHAQHALGWLLRKRGQYAEAEAWLSRARESYQTTGDPAGVSRTLADTGEIQRLQGKYAEAKTYYDQSLQLAGQLEDPSALRAARAHALKGAGTVATWQGDYVTARALNEESLALRRDLGDTPGVATLLNNLGIIARFQHDLAGARQMNEESLSLFREIGDRWAVGQLLNNQACVASDQGQYAEARSLLQESLAIRRQLGDKAGLALSLNTLADVVLDEGDYGSARPLLDESLVLSRELGDQTAIAYLIEDYAGLAAAEGRHEHALQLAGFASGLRDTIGAPLPPAEQARVDRMIAPARLALPMEGASQAWDTGCSMKMDEAVRLALGGPPEAN